MLEANESLLPKSSKKGSDGRDARLNVICIGTEDHPLDELIRLLDTLGTNVAGSVIASTRKISPSTYITQGKLEGAKALLESTGADGVVVDVELSPNQLRNAEAFLGKPVIDRPGVIIEIFSAHARTMSVSPSFAFATYVTLRSTDTPVAASPRAAIASEPHTSTRVAAAPPCNAP